MKTFIFILLALVAGYIAGRYHSPGEVITRHVEAPPVTGSVALPSRVPDLPKISDLHVARLVFIPDTILRADTIRVIDTIASYRATVEDWNEERRYQRTLFDDLNGKLDIAASVRFNTLTTLDYAFTPIRTETTIKPRKGLTPFAGISFGVSGIAACGGLFYRDIGLAASYGTKGIDVHLLFNF
jgi:hypothetical protein